MGRRRTIRRNAGRRCQSPLLLLLPPFGFCHPFLLERDYYLGDGCQPEPWNPTARFTYALFSQTCKVFAGKYSHFPDEKWSHRKAE